MFDDEESNLENQIEIYEEQLEAKAEELRDLEGSDAPEVEIKRKELGDEIIEIQIALQRALETQSEAEAEQEDMDEGLDWAND